MKKRLFTLVLTVALLLTLVPLNALQVSAASSFVTSEGLIDMIKEWEGFSAKPYWDIAHYTIGYGTMVPDDKYDEWMANGITEEEGEALLRESLGKTETRVNKFLDDHNINGTQGIFDAMVSLSFNCGAAWLYEESTLRTSIIEGWTGNDLLFAFGQWSTAAGETRDSLIRRRLKECNMYLNGKYSDEVPADYCYVKFKPNGGTCEIKTQCYDSDTPADIRAVPTYSGYTFVGWYTDATGGEKVTKLDAGVRNYTLYAHWTANSGTNVSDSGITGSTVSYQRKIAAGELNAFAQPVAGSAVVHTYEKDELVSIVAEYYDADGIKWGKTSDGHWINQGYTVSPSGAADSVNLKVKVTGTGVNIRRGPGLSYARVGTATKGVEITITETYSADGYIWGKYTKGWIALKYTNYSSVVSGGNNNNTGNTETDKADKVIATGKVRVSDSLNIRKGPSTGYQVVGSLKNNAAVEILEIQTVGSTKWGRITKGWISLDYVTLDKTEDADDNTGNDNTGNDNAGSDNTGNDNTGNDNTGNDNTGNDNTGNDNTGNDNTGNDNTGSDNTGNDNTGSDNTGSDNTDTNEPETLKGVVDVETNSWLNVREGAGTGFKVVAKLLDGAEVEITEQKTVSGVLWGKTAKGWVSMDYIKIKTADGSTSTAVTGTVAAGSNQLRIRTSPSTSASVAGYLNTGDKVIILEQKTVDGTKWGRIDKGWIVMTFVSLDKQENTTQTGKVVTVTASALYIRSGAGTTNKIVGSLPNGSKVTVLETKTVKGEQWGRISKGWICLTYVK